MPDQQHLKSPIEFGHNFFGLTAWAYSYLMASATVASNGIEVLHVAISNFKDILGGD